MEAAAETGGDGTGEETGDRGLGVTNTGIQTMVANLVKEALKEIGNKKTEAKTKKQRDPEDTCKDLAAGHCKHGFNGSRHGGCVAYHPKICDQIKAGAKTCSKDICHLNHPPICETYNDFTVICEQKLLKVPLEMGGVALQKNPNLL